jgi:hypothetical protein
MAPGAVRSNLRLLQYSSQILRHHAHITHHSSKDVIEPRHDNLCWCHLCACLAESGDRGRLLCRLLVLQNTPESVCILTHVLPSQAFILWPLPFQQGRWLPLH